MIRFGAYFDRNNEYISVLKSNIYQLNFRGEMITRNKSHFKFLVLYLLLTFTMSAQSVSVPFDSDKWQIRAGEVVDYLGQKAFKGMANLKDVDFHNGVIEFDVAFTGQRCFAGVNFRMQSPANYEHFYLRPHKSNLPDALQYTPVFNFVSSWQLYNGAGFTAAQDIPHNEWVHVKMEIKGSQARVYVNDMSKPAMEMPHLKQGDTKGTIGVFSPMNGVAHFANFSYSLTDDLDFAPAEKLYPPTGIISDWQLSQPITFNKVDLNEYIGNQDLELTWQNVSADKTGLVDIMRYKTRASREPDVIYAKYIYKSDKEEYRQFKFGYSDAIRIYVNGQPAFDGQGYFLSRDPGFQGIAGLFDAVYLPLKKGDNEIMLQIIETFGGWGFYFQDADYIHFDDSVKEIWSIGKDINIPESVVYDAKRDVLYCSNFGGLSPANQQTISTISIDGKILNKDWVTSLNRPTGMQIHEDKLYVVDRTNVNVIDLKTAEIVEKLAIPEPVFPNDIQVSKDGTIYVSDNDKGAIFRYANSKFEVWLTGEEVNRPNGILLVDNLLLWGNNGTFEFKSVDVHTKEIKTLKKFENILIDGIKIANDGSYLISDYNGIVYNMKKDGSLKVLINSKAQDLKQADFEFIRDKNMLIIPSLYSNYIKAYKLN